MDLVMIGKFQSMKRYQRRSHFLPFLLLVSLGLVLSSPLWRPLVCSTIFNHLFTVFLPKMAALAPKCLFIVSNTIIIFLVCESKSSPPSVTRDVYEEHAQQSQTHFKQPIIIGEEVKEDIVVGGCHSVEKSNEKNESPNLNEKIVNEKDEAVKEDEEEMDDDCVKEDEMRSRVECEESMGGQNEEEEEDEGLPVDELNRRVEDFIARMNSHRMVEARMVVSYR